MKVPHSKGVANHAVPESCAWSGRKAHREALTGVRAGQPLSRDSTLIPGADAVGTAEGHTARRANASAALTRRGQRPWHVRTLLAREPGDRWVGLGLLCQGPHREGEEP